MRTLVRALSVCLVVVWGTVATASFVDKLIEFGVEEAFRIGLDNVGFLYDIHLNAEDRTPLPIDKDFQIGTNLFPTMIPFSELNISGKAKLQREHGVWPQIDVNVGGWDSIAGTIASSMVEDFKGGLYGLHGGISAAVSADPRLRIFAGYEFSQMRADVDITFKPANDALTTSVQSALSHIHGGITEHFLFAGAEVLRSSRKRLVAEIGYGVVNNRLVARLTWASKSFDTGFAFYPEGAWVVWPVWNFQVRF